MSKTFVSCSTIMLTATLLALPAWSQQKPQDKPAASQPSGIQGSWSGSVLQLGRSTPYALTMTLTKDGGSTDYPGLKCQGKLTRVGASGGYTFFAETITKGGLAQGGQCINGSVTVLSAGAKLAWGWVGADAGAAIAAVATLTRK
jgi:hypothetical protein